MQKPSITYCSYLAGQLRRKASLVFVLGDKGNISVKHNSSLFADYNLQIIYTMRLWFVRDWKVVKIANNLSKSDQ